MKRFVICTVSVEGFHCWPDAPDGELAYLRDRHRHIFEIRMEFQVQDNDREIEINQRQREIREWLIAKYAPDNSVCEFGGLACEHIAEELLLTFDAASCQVLEDGYGGAKIVR